MTEQVWWFATRGAGLMTWSMATMSVIVGLLMSTKLMGRNPGFPWLLDLHRFLSGLSLGFLGLHMITLWADSYVTFGWAELFLPFASEWRPGAVAWGVVAMYLMIAVELSSLIKDRIPARLWHGIHLTSFVVMAFGTVHAWQSGTDVHNPLLMAFGLASLAIVVGLTGFRVALVRGAVPTPKPRSDRTEMLRQARNRAAAEPPRRTSVASRWLEAVGKH